MRRASRMRQYVSGIAAAAMVFASVASGAVANAQSGVNTSVFTDIAGNPHAHAIRALHAAGVINGVSSTAYDPTANVTRAQMAKIVVDMMGKGTIATALATQTPGYVDAANIPSWAWGYVNVATDLGVINGFPSGKFHPNRAVTDVQAAAMLIRAVGDSSAVTGTWPGNYVAAAYNLGVANEMHFVASLPASRAQAAQMAYNAAVDAPAGFVSTSSATTTSGVTSTTTTNQPNAPLWLQSGGSNGLEAYRGTVSGVSSSSITLTILGNTSKANYGPFQGQTITLPFAATYSLAGVTNFNALVGQTVVALAKNSGAYGAQYGDVVFLKPTSNTTISAQTGTLGSTASGSLVPALPSGYLTVSVAGTSYPWLATNNPSCVDVGSLTAFNTSPCSAALSLLIGSSTATSSTTGTTVSLATYYSTASPVSGITGTSLYYVNAPSAGVAVDPTAQVANVTNLTEGDAVSYTTSSQGTLAALYENNNVTYQVGVVTSTTCASGCNNTSDGVPSIAFNVNGSGYAVQVQPWTALDLNKQSTSLSSSLDNATAYVAVVGNDNAISGTSPMPNATSIQMYNSTVAGTLTGYTTSTSAHLSGPKNIYYQNGLDSGQGYSNLTIQTSTGTTTYPTDGNFNPGTSSPTNLVSGQPITVVLDSGNLVRKVISTPPTANLVATPALAIGETTSNVSGTVTSSLNVTDASGTSVSLTLPALSTPPMLFNSGYVSPFTSATNTVTNTTYTVFSGPTVASSTQGPGNPEGAILFATNSSGNAVEANGTSSTSSIAASVTAPGNLTQVIPIAPAGTSGAVWTVSAASGGTAILQGNSVTNASGATYSTAQTTQQLAVFSGQAFYNNSGTWTATGIGSLTVGHVVDVYQGTYLGNTYYVIIDTGSGVS